MFHLHHVATSSAPFFLCPDYLAPFFLINVVKFLTDCGSDVIKITGGDEGRAAGVDPGFVIGGVPKMHV